MTILCPIDFSAATEALVRYAATLAAGTGGELRLLHVLEPGPLPATNDVELAQRLALHREAALAAGARVTTAVTQGDAAAEIVAEARRHPAAMIVIGAHGQTGLTRFLMGSTAETVVRTAPCVTLLVKPGCSQAYRQSA
ncbi:universal stress protein [Hymenobacter psychrotolerans]|uniref:Nucleotide-binding universal stress protein, UspA family n=1 Tax=Hymenobacter psychrotolerans DSM 18569 TaxID=1121959 RepID=A0A1M6PHP8_9BACT|nr:universal stress protein [Hymenobacter psychrotolerans]SHK07466.1 Nucleotide-binding universal stress protein, UspA family [Hymenobacter psychrotolerans DSM 18569]